MTASRIIDSYSHTLLGVDYSEIDRCIDAGRPNRADRDYEWTIDLWSAFVRRKAIAEKIKISRL